MMRYHWGLGVGHLHAHQPSCTEGCVPEAPENAQDIQTQDYGQDDVLRESDAIAHNQDGDSEVYDSDNPELGWDDRQSEGWSDVESDELEDGDRRNEDENMEDEDYTGM
jgi:hypothetical protein